MQQLASFQTLNYAHYFLNLSLTENKFTDFHLFVIYLRRRISGGNIR